MNPDGMGGDLLGKFVAAMAGAIASVLVVPPQSRSEFVRRMIAAVLAGIALAVPVRDWLRFSMDIEGVLAGGFIAAFAGWWAMGVVQRAVAAWRPK